MTNNIDFIGIGAPRCGTSWIANVLRSHPDICISEPKEVRYFNRNEMQIGKLKGNINPNFDKDISWYLKRFSHAKKGQLCGEISPVYLSDEAAPAAIKSQYPNVKLIVCLRNPVDRAYSFYKLHSGNSIIETMSFEQALKQESVYIETGLYGKSLARYLEHFDREKILFLVFEELIAKPEQELSRIFEFLGVEPLADLNPSKFHTNKSANRRSDKLQKFAYSVSQWLIGNGFSNLLKWLRAVGVHKLLNKINFEPMPKDNMQDATRAYLNSEFREDILKLEELFDVDLSKWK